MDEWHFNEFSQSKGCNVCFTKNKFSRVVSSHCHQLLISHNMVGSMRCLHKYKILKHRKEMVIRKTSS